MITSSNQIRVELCNKSPIYLGTCIRNLISGGSRDKLYVSFCYDFLKGEFIIDNEKVFARNAPKIQPSLATYQSLLLEHSKNCPCAVMNANPEIYSFESTSTFIRLACSTLIVDSKDNILLTRRDKKLRSFPGAWVNAGGRLDPEESLDECALRELHEEVGIDIERKEGPIKGSYKYVYAGRECEIKPFFIWESIYPTLLDYGFPKVQYILIFYYVKIGCENTKIKIKIQDQEIDKAIWINLRTLMENIETKKISELLTIQSVIPTGGLKNDQLPSETFEGIYPNAIKEGIGEGHLQAMKNYYFRFCENFSEFGSK